MTENGYMNKKNLDYLRISAPIAEAHNNQGVDSKQQFISAKVANTINIKKLSLSTSFRTRYCDIYIRRKEIDFCDNNNTIRRKSRMPTNQLKRVSTPPVL
jgi:hypothetical protein